jgi:hypothetical protein
MPFEPTDFEPPTFEPSLFEPWVPVAFSDVVTTLTIGGVDMDGDAWAAAGIFGLSFTWDLDSYWSLAFSVVRTCNGMLPYVPGVPISLSIDYGMGPQLRFVGDLQRPDGGPCAEGYQWNYTASDLRRRGDYVTLTGLDGSGTTSFNLNPDDYLYLFNTSGQTVGQVVTAVLTQATNAAALDALGVGAYVTLTPPTLPPETVADLAALTIVPPEPIQLSGETLLNTIAQFILHWHSKYAMWVGADGVIRVKSIFSLPPVAVALPASDGSGAEVDWPGVTVDCTECYTSWSIQGLDIQSASLSQHDGTLAKGWTSMLESQWTIADFLQPKDGADQGSCSGVTSTSCTVHSDHAPAHWVAGYWNGPTVGGWIQLFNLAGSGIAIYETRQVTSCTAMSPGGTAMITWSSGEPLPSTGFTRYRLIGQNTPLGLVGRDYAVREPATGALGRSTLVGANMYPRNPKGMPIANNSRVFLVFSPYAFVQWSQTGNWPWFEVPVNVQLDPVRGHVILTEPAVVKSAGLAGTTSLLARKYPTSFSEGLYYDVRVEVPYNRGLLSARAPMTGDQGTAFTAYGIVRPKVQHLDTFNWAFDAASLVMLAQERLDCVKDAVVSGEIAWKELPDDFDPFVPGFSLSVSASGSTTPLDGLDLPVRSCTIRWHDDGPSLHTVSMRFSNLKRPFQGDSLYTHPAFAGGTFGTQGEMFGFLPGGQSVAGMEMAYFNEASGQIGYDAAASTGSNPISDALAGRGSGDRVSEIAANNQAIGDQLRQQSDPGNFFEPFHRAVGADVEASHAPFAQALGEQAQAARSGDPFGVMEGFRPSLRSLPKPPPRPELHDPAAGAPINPESGPPPPPQSTPIPPPPRPRPGGLAERRGRRDDDDTTSGGG